MEYKKCVSGENEMTYKHYKLYRLSHQEISNSYWYLKCTIEDYESEDYKQKKQFGYVNAFYYRDCVCHKKIICSIIEDKFNGQILDWMPINNPDNWYLSNSYWYCNCVVEKYEERDSRQLLNTRFYEDCLRDIQIIKAIINSKHNGNILKWIPDYQYKKALHEIYYKKWSTRKILVEKCENMYEQ